MLNTALLVIVVMGIVGLTFGLILAVVNKKFSVEVNPLIHIVEDALPKGQCGACGFAGCMAYAEAVVMDPSVPPTLCTPGKSAVAKVVGELTGKAAPEMEARIAHVKCAGTKDKTEIKYIYTGVQDCSAAMLLQGGPKGCQYGCMGFGSCSRGCPFDALDMGPDGLPIVNLLKCTGCGKCETICPKNVIDMVPVGHHVSVECNSNDKGAVARKLCQVACIGCGICKKSCPHEAIEMVNNLAVVNTKVCMEKCDNPVCVEKCPTKAIIAKAGRVHKPAAQA